MKISISNSDYTLAWQANLTPRQIARVDNGRLISCGLTLGEDLKESTLKTWIRKGIASPVDPEKANHSGCQSRCILRGDSLCQW